MLYAPKPMHIPDGFLSTAVSLILWAISILMIGIALRRVNRQLGERQVPLMGVLAAAIFAGQMLNFTVAGGTSGHLLGAALATILLGPWAAMVVMTAVVSIQALLFQDGGLLALGANIFNMAVVGVAVSYAFYRFFQGFAGGRRWGIFIGGFAAAWASIFIASLAVGLQLALSGTSPANIAIPAMGGIHALIGIGEGLITTGALAFLYAARKDLLEAGSAVEVSSKGVLTVGGLITLILAVLSPLASSHPDGLEWVAQRQGFLNQARSPFYHLIPDYVMPGIADQRAATVAAAVLGSLIVFTVAYGIARGQKQRNASEKR